MGSGFKKGLNFRNYGEFIQAEVTDPEDVSWSQMYEEYKNDTHTITIKAKSQLHTLDPYNCPTFRVLQEKYQMCTGQKNL